MSDTLYTNQFGVDFGPLAETTTYTKSVDIDAILRAVKTKTLDVDAVLRISKTTGVDLDALIIYLISRNVDLTADVYDMLGWAWGQEDTSYVEIPEKWSVWKDWAGDTATYDAVWGKLQLKPGDTFYSDVKDMGSAVERLLTIDIDKYGSGSGTQGTIEWRGSATEFAWNASDSRIIRVPWQKPLRGTLLNKNHPLSRGLVGAWVMNEGSGGKVFDLSGYGNEGTLSGASWAAGRTGAAIDFNGTSAVECDLSFNTNTMSQVTLLVRVWAESGAQVDTYAGLVAFPGVQPFEIAQDAGGNRLRYRIRADDTNVFLYGNYSFWDGAWHTVALTWNGANAFAYEDGVEVDTQPQTGSVVEDGVYCDFGRGYRNGNYFDGLIEYGLFYNRALTAAEIAWLHREPYAMFTETRRGAGAEWEEYPDGGAIRDWRYVQVRVTA